jgi:hypothetical protein
MSAEYRFRIAGSYTPATLPMERLAEYMAALSKFLGEEQSVHFQAVEAGSAVVVAKIDDLARPKVSERVLGVRIGQGSREAQKAYSALDDMLRKDNATGWLSSEVDAVVLAFPGRERPEPLVFGPFKQDGTLDGQVIRVGGKDETVPIHLRDGAVIHTGLYATPELAQAVAKHFLGPFIRVHGTGTWFRSSDGSWELRNFKVTSFDVLDETSLKQVVNDLRRVRGSRWNELPDPIRELLDRRHDEGDAH